MQDCYAPRQGEHGTSAQHCKSGIESETNGRRSGRHKARPSPADDRDPDMTPGAAPVGTLMVQDIGGPRWAERRERAVEERRVTLALREAILPEPGASIDLPYARIAVRYVPAGRASSLGGDWYDAAPLPDGRMFLAVGDVSGHGLPAIAEMAQLRHALLGLSMTGACPGRLLTWLNTLVLTRLDDTTATAVCGHFDPATRLFTWAQAGHPARSWCVAGARASSGRPGGSCSGRRRACRTGWPTSASSPATCC